jgi:hypothetical protein
MDGDVEVLRWLTRIHPRRDGYGFELTRASGGKFRVDRVSCSLPVGDTLEDKLTMQEPEHAFDPETGEPNPMVPVITQRVNKGGRQAYTPTREMKKATRSIEFVYPRDFEGADWPLPEGEHQIQWHVEVDAPRSAVDHMGGGWINVVDGEPIVVSKPETEE